MCTDIFPPRNACDYAQYFCEENIWKLCKKASASEEKLLHCFVVFISNTNETIPLWKQRLAILRGYLIWDYHVILLYKESNAALIYDFDTALEFPCDAVKYWTETFRPDVPLAVDFLRYFRVLNAADYLQRFSSDRRHMLGPDGNYRVPLPSWPPIYNQGDGHNLPSFISMDSELLKDISKVYDEDSFSAFITNKI